MKFFTGIWIFVFLFCSTLFGQELTREQKFQKIDELKNQVKVLENELFQPDEKDLSQAQKEGFGVFRLLPREKYDGKLIVQGGGSFYSFTEKTHDYQKNVQIHLEQKNLSVGFAGANYGFIADLGESALADVTKETPEVNFLVNYKPPTNEPDVRIEQRKAWNYEANGFLYKNSVPAVVGHSYVLRAITFGRSDVLVAFKIYRKDTDGSLIIFWKLMENFEKPLLAKNE